MVLGCGLVVQFYEKEINIYFFLDMLKVFGTAISKYPYKNIYYEA